MKADLVEFEFSFDTFLEEREALEDLLDTDEDLKEKDDLQDFFYNHPHVAASLGIYSPGISTPNRIGFECPIYEKYVADIVVGNYERGQYTLIELEDASSNSIFQDASRKTSKWSWRFYQGFSQLIDWKYVLEERTSKLTLQQDFGKMTPTFLPLLLVGRRTMLTQEESDRLDWHADRVVVASRPFLTVTFDDAVDYLWDQGDHLRHVPRE